MKPTGTLLVKLTEPAVNQSPAPGRGWGAAKAREAALDDPLGGVSRRIRRVPSAGPAFDAPRRQPSSNGQRRCGTAGIARQVVRALSVAAAHRVPKSAARTSKRPDA